MDREQFILAAQRLGCRESFLKRLLERNEDFGVEASYSDLILKYNLADQAEDDNPDQRFCPVFRTDITAFACRCCIMELSQHRVPVGVGSLAAARGLCKACYHSEWVW